MLKGDIFDRDQRMLLNYVKVAGCPETQKDNGVYLILYIVKKIDVDLNEKDIISAYRAGPERSTGATSVTSGQTNSIYILTNRSRNTTKYEPYFIKRVLGLASINTDINGLEMELKILVCQAQGKLRHRLRTEEDVHRVFDKNHVGS